MRTILKVKVKGKFDAAHMLPDYSGKCVNLHGHTWHYAITISGEVSNNGMVVDFKKVREFVKACIEDIYDHKLINDVIDNPTAELIVLNIVTTIANQRLVVHSDLIRDDRLFMLEAVELWETEDNCIIWERSLER